MDMKTALPKSEWIVAWCSPEDVLLSTAVADDGSRRWMKIPFADLLQYLTGGDDSETVIVTFLKNGAVK